MNLLNLILGKRPTSRQQRRALAQKRRAETLARMGMGPRPKLNPPPKAKGYKSGDKRKGPAS